MIVRPHPYSIKIESKYINLCQKLTLPFQSIKWDFSNDPSLSMSNADLLISDTSAIRFDFAFIYDKPVITLLIPELSLNSFEVYSLEENWSEKIAKQIGTIIKYNDTSEIIQNVSNLIAKKNRNSFLQLRNKFIANINMSADKIISYLRLYL